MQAALELSRQPIPELVCALVQVDVDQEQQQIGREGEVADLDIEFFILCNDVALRLHCQGIELAWLAVDVFFFHAPGLDREQALTDQLEEGHFWLAQLVVAICQAETGSAILFWEEVLVQDGDLGVDLEIG